MSVVDRIFALTFQVGLLLLILVPFLLFTEWAKVDPANEKGPCIRYETQNGSYPMWINKTMVMMPTSYSECVLYGSPAPRPPQAKQLPGRVSGH